VILTSFIELPRGIKELRPVWKAFNRLYHDNKGINGDKACLEGL